MAYFGQSSRMAGDPGFFDTLGRIGRGAVGFLTGGPIGGARGLFSPPTGGGMPVVRTPGIRGAAQRMVPGGKTGYMVETLRKKRRRMNYGNAKALKRAIRRQDGFVKLAKDALKGTNYQIVTRSSRRSKRDLGKGHTHVR